MEFLGRDEEKNLEIMMKDIDINVIPKNCGGNNIKIFWFYKFKILFLLIYITL